MSNSAINWARSIRGLTSPQAFVLWVICDRYNEETHTAWPSISSIAADTRLATRTVSRALAALEERSRRKDSLCGGKPSRPNTMGGLRIRTFFRNMIHAQQRPRTWSFTK